MHLPGRLLLLSVTVLFLSGCVAARVATSFVQPPIPSFHSNPGGVPIRRVAVLPIYCEEQAGTAAPDGLDLIFHAELTKTSAFEIVPVSREELATRYGIDHLSSADVIPRDLLLRIISEYGAEGILFTDLTHYSAYRPISMGIRCKLVDARSGEQRWVFDHLFDSGNPDIAIAAKDFSVRQENEQLPIPTDGMSILQSPSQFGKYVAHETYRSLLGI